MNDKKEIDRMKEIDKQCQVCNGQGCPLCQQDIEPVYIPVYINVKLNLIIEVLHILDRAKNPSVKFNENMEQMRKEANKISETNLHNAIVILNEMVAK